MANVTWKPETHCKSNWYVEKLQNKVMWKMFVKTEHIDSVTEKT